MAASKLVPDDIVQMITASGTPDEVRAKVDEYVATGCTCPILYPLGADVHQMIDVFATSCSGFVVRSASSSRRVRLVAGASLAGRCPTCNGLIRGRSVATVTP